MARKKAEKKVEEIDEEIIDLEDYDEDFDDEEIELEDDEFEVEKPKKEPKKEVPLTLDDRVAIIEKKTSAVLILCVVAALASVVTMCVTIFGGNSNKNNSSKDTTETNESAGQEEEITYEYDVSKFNEISASDIAKVSKDKTILLYIGRSTCGYCVQYVPVLQEVQDKYGTYTTYYLDIAKIYDYSRGVKIDEDAESIMLNLKTSDSQKDVMQNFGSTPMTLVIKNGRIVDSIIGYVDAGTLDALVTDNGLNK